MEQKNEKNIPSPKFPKMTPDIPATEKQRALLRLAIKKNWLQPNSFIGNYKGWDKLTSAEAEDMLALIPSKRLGVLEKELKKEFKERRDRGIARNIGRSIEGGIKQIGHTIDGGIQ